MRKQIAVDLGRLSQMGRAKGISNGFTTQIRWQKGFLFSAKVLRIPKPCKFGR